MKIRIKKDQEVFASWSRGLGVNPRHSKDYAIINAVYLIEIAIRPVTFAEEKANTDHL